MPIGREPKPLPSELSYVPPESAPYRVSNRDSWWTLAERSDVKAARMSASDLCYFNFRTRVPEEINWYLYHKVGCRTATRDGKNYMFSAGDTPGIVYLPKVGAPKPVTEIPPKQAEQRLNAWAGFGVKAGTQFVVVGIETLTGYVASLDDLGKGMAIAASINRVGPGFGASGGVCLIYVTGVKSPGQLAGFQQGDMDFNLSLGGNWGKIGQFAAKAQKLSPLLKVLAAIGGKTPSALKAALKAHPDKWVELIKAGKSLKESLGIDPDGPPNILVVDLPAGGGIEASVFYGLSNFEAVWDVD